MPTMTDEQYESFLQFMEEAINHLREREDAKPIQPKREASTSQNQLARGVHGKQFHP